MGFWLSRPPETAPRIGNDEPSGCRVSCPPGRRACMLHNGSSCLEKVDWSPCGNARGSPCRRTIGRLVVEGGFRPNDQRGDPYVSTLENANGDGAGILVTRPCSDPD